jgi:hypothetical protein
MSVRDLDRVSTDAELNADAARVARAQTREERVRQHTRIYGIGRMSIVDYEDHEYSFTLRNPSDANATHGASGRGGQDRR